MRVALVGWDTDDVLLDALAGLGLEPVAWTRWFPDLPWREERAGWVRHRCPHQIGHGAEGEAWSFRESVLARDLETGQGRGFDLIHVLDPMAVLAAQGLAERYPLAARVASITADAGRSSTAAAFASQRWISDDPVAAEGWLAQHPVDAASVAIVPSWKLLEQPAHVPEPEPYLLVLMPVNAEVDPAPIVSAVATLRAERPGLGALVWGRGTGAERLRRRLDERGLLLARPEPQSTRPEWCAWIAGASVVAIASEHPADDPLVAVCWALGKPVIRLEASDPPALLEAMREAFSDQGRIDRELRAARAMAIRRLAPEGVALGWLCVYLEAVTRPHRVEMKSDESRPSDWALSSLVHRTRLILVAIGPRELYAWWQVRGDDRASALEWLGPDAAHASLVIRLFDITDILFHGTNAHGYRDVELSFSEQFRTIGLDAPGRSVAASLGLRSRHGYFHPLAHAGPTHLPREAAATQPPSARLRVLPRRA